MKKKDLKDELSEYSLKLLRLKKRLYLLKAIEAKLALRTDSKGKVHLKNIEIYEMAADTYNMLVIDLCSFCNHFAEEGGFIRHLNNHLARLQKRNPKKIEVSKGIILNTDHSEEEIKHTQSILQEFHKKRFADSIEKSLNFLFPSWNGSVSRFTKWGFIGKIIEKILPSKKRKYKVDQSDIEALRVRFKNAVRSIDEDRNIHKAHRYEKESVKKSKLVLPMSLTEVERVFNTIQEILSHLWIVSELSDYIFNSDLNTDSEQTAQDLVDLMVYRSINQIVNDIGIHDALKNSQSSEKYYWQFRKKIK